MKTLKFSGNLLRSIITGKKTTTWRINDEKNITEGETISLINKNTMKEFVKAEVVSIRETTFEKINESDRNGHEKFRSDKEMYEIYSNYYKIKVTPKTKLKVIKFKITEKI
jgi:hypothetical protein